jgi:hypothetical protein
VWQLVFGGVQEEVMRRWSKLHNEELYSFCPLVVVISASKSRRRRRTKYVERMSVLAVNIDDPTLTVRTTPRSERGNKGIVNGVMI